MRWILLLLLAWTPAAAVLAHEIPADVRVRIYLVPDGERIEALLRVPLVAMRDVDFALTGPGYLDLSRVSPQLETAARLWLTRALTLRADGRELATPTLAAVRVALPSDRSFDAANDARAAVYGQRLDETVNLYWEQALLDVALVYRNPAGAQAELEADPRFGRLGLNTVTTLTVVQPDGGQRTLVLTADPGMVSLDPGMWAVFGRFLGEGFRHVLDGTDHLLFVLALVIPLLVIRPLVVAVTAFTLAHSLTLGAAALDLVPAALWFPPLVELLIAGSIFYMALENIFTANLRRRWIEAFGFGLIHGFGFSFALGQALPFAGDHLLLSLAGFNVGIELGQLLVLAVAVPVLRLVTRKVPARTLGIVLSALIAHTAWHWLEARWAVLRTYDLTLGELDTAFALGVTRWVMLLLSAALLVWLLHRPFERWAAAGASEP